MKDKELTRAKEYALIKNELFILELTLSILFLLICLVTPLSKFLRDIAYKTSENTFFLAATYLSLFYLLAYIVILPLSFYRGFILEHKYNLSNLTLKAWIKKEFKQNAIFFFVVLFMTQTVYIFLNVSAKTWWFKSAIMWILVSIFLTKITPNVLLPLFYKYKPLTDDKLKRRLLWLAHQAGSTVSAVEVIDFSRETKKANAALIGMGKNKKIILTDTLLDNFYQDEIEVILAHELAHEKFKHIWKLLAFNSMTTLMGFYIVGLLLSRGVDVFGFYRISDIAGFPLLALLLFLFGLIVMPVQNYYSRALENEADIYALESTNNHQAFISAMVRLGRQNLADMTPPAWVEFLLYDHPSIINRVKQADLLWQNKELKRRYV